MSLNTLITDPATGAKASIDPSKTKGTPNALVVANRDLYSYENAVKFFTHPLYGFNLARDFTTGGGSEECVHNGLDTVCWTAAALSGPWVFNSTTEAHPPSSQSIEGATGHLDTASLTRGSTLTLTDVNSLEGWIYLTSWTGTKQNIELHFYLAGNPVGNSVLLSNYVNTANVGNWQKFTIPFTDFALVGLDVDELQITTYDSGVGGISYFLDDIMITFTTGGTGLGTQTFTCIPDDNTWLYCMELNFMLADAISAIQTDSTMHKIDYNSFMGLTLESGIIYQRIVKTEIDLSLTVKNLSDIIQVPGSNLKTAWYETEMFLLFNVKFLQPIELRADRADELRVILSDDYSDLSMFKLVIGGRYIDWNQYLKEQLNKQT